MWWGLSNCLGSNNSQITPHMRAKFGSGPTVVSEKRGGVHSDRHTYKGTLQLYIVLAEQQPVGR